MGIVVPRPALRARGNRRIKNRLALHATLMAKYEAEGLPRDEASKRAYAEVIEKIK